MGQDSRLRESIAATLVALALLYFVGFAPGVFHNAAHDFRHTAAIPCH